MLESDNWIEDAWYDLKAFELQRHMYSIEWVWSRWIRQ